MGIANIMQICFYLGPWEDKFIGYAPAIGTASQRLVIVYVMF